MSSNDKAASARDSALKGALQQIEREFGTGTVMRMGDEGAKVAVDAIPTGALSLDLALGIGGVPRGRIVEVFGPESSGKTTLIYHILAEAQKLGGVCAFIDAEHAMDPLYAKEIGVDIDELLVSQPDHGEQALEIADMLVRSSAVDVVAVDSVAALTPRAELEGQMGDQTVGLQARMMSQAMRKLAGNLNRTQTLCIFTNQIREKVGVMFGSPETQPGGRALKFYSSQRLDIRRIETLKDGTEAVGNRVRVKVVKNKVAAPFRQAEFDIEFGKGISSAGCILDLGLEHDVVSKSGSFFSYGDERIGQGRNNAKGYLVEHPEVAREIEDKIYDALGIDRDADAADRGRRTRASGRPRGRARAGVRRRPPERLASPERWTRATARSTSPTGTWRARPHGGRGAPAPGGQGVDPAASTADGARAGASRATSTTRATPAASPRTAARSTTGAPSASSAACCAVGVEPDAGRRRARRSGRRGRARRGGRAAARAASRRRPRDDRERNRALGLLVRRGYELDSRTTRSARSSAPAADRAPVCAATTGADYRSRPAADDTGPRGRETRSKSSRTPEPASLQSDGQPNASRTTSASAAS